MPYVGQSDWSNTAAIFFFFERSPVTYQPSTVSRPFRISQSFTLCRTFCVNSRMSDRKWLALQAVNASERSSEPARGITNYSSQITNHRFCNVGTRIDWLEKLFTGTERTFCKKRQTPMRATSLLGTSASNFSTRPMSAGMFNLTAS